MTFYPQGSAENLETKSYLNEVVEGTSRIPVPASTPANELKSIHTFVVQNGKTKVTSQVRCTYIDTLYINCLSICKTHNTHLVKIWRLIITISVEFLVHPSKTEAWLYLYDTHVFVFALEGNSYVFLWVLNVFQCEDKESIESWGKRSFLV